MRNTISWEEAPSPNGLKMELEYKPESSLSKRTFVRIEKNDIIKLFMAGNILVKVATV